MIILEMIDLIKSIWDVFMIIITNKSPDINIVNSLLLSKHRGQFEQLLT